MKRDLSVFVLLSFILILSLTFVSAGWFNDIFGKITGKVIADVDLTPRIAYWCGKVNQHTENGVWVTDSDGSSSCYEDTLTYCKKFYPSTLSFKEYDMETIITWRDTLGNTYTSTKQSYECISPCTTDNNCSKIDLCQESSCGNGTCLYSFLSCEENGNCCRECTLDAQCKDGDACSTDICSLGKCLNVFIPDCTPCVADFQCEEYNSETEEYCSVDKTKVYKNVSAGICNMSDIYNGICVKNETQMLVNNCSVNEKCYAGSCFNISDISNECTINDECVMGKSCILGKCTSDKLLDCESEGNFCMSQANCDSNGGSILENSTCMSEYFICCDTETTLRTCVNDEGGEVCASDESCIDGEIIETSDAIDGETCCVGGTCEGEIVTSDCVSSEGICKSFCGSKEKEGDSILTDSCNFGEICCTAKIKSSSLWIWILLIFIFFSVLGVVFRDKLKTLFGRKEDKKKSYAPLTSHSNPQGMILSQRILSPLPSKSQIRKSISSRQSIINKKFEEKPKDELDEVLKKLKEGDK